MAVHPDDRVSTHYEWVVETVQVHNEDCEDIIDCSYWPEKELAQALADAKSTTPPTGGRVDFALARSTGCEAEGMTDRGYAYHEGGVWPTGFDNGKSIPARFNAMLARVDEELS